MSEADSQTGMIVVNSLDYGRRGVWRPRHGDIRAAQPKISKPAVTHRPYAIR